MSSYYLLRNNLESGPYTLTEIQRLVFRAGDLVWKQGESHCWNTPTEMEEFRDCLYTNEEACTKATTSSSVRLMDIFDRQEVYSNASFMSADALGENAAGVASIGTFQQRYPNGTDPKKLGALLQNLVTSLLWMVVFALSIIVTFLIVKKAFSRTVPEQTINHVVTSKHLSVPQTKPAIVVQFPSFSSLVNTSKT